MDKPQHQPEWNVRFQRYLVTSWNEQYRRYYWQHYVEGHGWVFFDWVPVEQDVQNGTYREPVDPYQRPDSGAGVHVSRRYGHPIQETYNPNSVDVHSHFEKLDPSFYVRSKDFFHVGRVFAVLFSEGAGATSLNYVTEYNDSLSRVKYGEFVHTQVRRFVVVSQKREFCFAVPIFTYNNRGTTKRGVVPEEHAIIYSHGYQPQLVVGEAPLSKESICMVMAEGQARLPIASRIYFGIQHPVQYNVKVKDLGYVREDCVATLLGYWHMEHGVYGDLAPSIASTPSARIIGSEFEEVRNPPNFFKIARVFMTPWTEPDGSSGEPFTKTARFVVVKPGPTFSVCLRISTYSGQATTKSGVVAHQHAAVIPQGGEVVLHDGEYLSKEPIEIKVENEDVDVSTMSRINFAKPYTVEHNVKVKNVGRVVGESVKRLEKYFAESLGFIKPSLNSV